MRTSRRPTAALAFLLVIALLLAACGDGDGGDEGATGTDATGDATTTAPADDDDAVGSATDDDETDDDADDDADADEASVPTELDFVLDDVRGGAAVEGAAFAGQDLVVWFWAPWCTKCNQEAPAIAEMSGRRDDVRFLGMAGLDELGAAADFVDRHGLDGFPHAFDEDGDTWSTFGITSQSSFAFVNDDGSYEIVDYSVLGADELDRRIDELVAS